MSRFDYTQAAPEGYKALLAFTHYITANVPDHKLLNLVFLRISQINGCAFCADMHAHDALAVGESQTRLNLLATWREAHDFFTDAERAALAWAESLTRLADQDSRGMHGPEGEKIYLDMRLHFGEKQTADLAFAVAAMNAWNRLGVGFKVAPPRRGQH